MVPSETTICLGYIPFSGRQPYRPHVPRAVSSLRSLRQDSIDPTSSTEEVQDDEAEALQNLNGLAL